jgi:hypothetical protein
MRSAAVDNEVSKGLLLGLQVLTRDSEPCSKSGALCLLLHTHM